MTEVFVIFGLATLYAAACPIASFVVLVFMLVFLNLKIRAITNYIRRPIPGSRKLGTFLNIA